MMQSTWWPTTYSIIIDTVIEQMLLAKPHTMYFIFTPLSESSKTPCGAGTIIGSILQIRKIELNNLQEATKLTNGRNLNAHEMNFGARRILGHHGGIRSSEPEIRRDLCGIRTELPHTRKKAVPLTRSLR